MKSNRMILTMFCALAPWIALAQETNPDRISIPLSNPERPATLKVQLLAGGISVKAYAGKEVIVEVKQALDEGSKERTEDGLKRIPNTSAGLTVEEDDNVVTVGTGYRGMNTEKQLTIQVPANTSVTLSTVNDGDIDVDGIKGEIEVNNTNGSVYLKNISGSAVAHALNGDLTANFLSVTPNKSMSFSSLNGKIDVTFPSSTKATLNLKSEQGEIYTDFDMVMEKSVPKIETEGKGSKRRVVMEKGMRGTINGGGAEFLFKNFNGDIIIRKGK